MFNDLEAERQRLVRIAMNNRRPCTVCDDENVCGIGSWIPDERHRLAAGGNNQRIPVFAFWLCELHLELTPENDKLIQQAVLRSVRINRGDFK